MSGSGHVHDLTHPWWEGMPVIAGDPTYRLQEVQQLESDGYRVHEFVAGSHTGTHIDAPAHILADGDTVDQLPLERLCGRARVLKYECEEPQQLTADLFGEQLLDFLNQPEPESIVLIATGWDRYFGVDQHRYARHPYLSAALAGLLRDQGVKLVGIDTFSPDPPEGGGLPVHQILLGAGIPIVENLKGLTELPVSVNFAAYPLPLGGADAAPIRAIARVSIEPNG